MFVQAYFFFFEKAGVFSLADERDDKDIGSRTGIGGKPVKFARFVEKGFSFTEKKFSASGGTQNVSAVGIYQFPEIVAFTAGIEIFFQFEIMYGHDLRDAEQLFDRPGAIGIIALFCIHDCILRFETCDPAERGSVRFYSFCPFRAIAGVSEVW